jgi:hypothetical protein
MAILLIKKQQKARQCVGRIDDHATDRPFSKMHGNGTACARRSRTFSSAMLCLIAGSANEQQAQTLGSETQF